MILKVRCCCCWLPFVGALLLATALCNFFVFRVRINYRHECHGYYATHGDERGRAGCKAVDMHHIPPPRRDTSKGCASRICAAHVHANGHLDKSLSCNPFAPYGHLISTVIHEKHIYREYVGLDACAANLMRPAMYGAYHHITVLGKENESCDHMYDVVGGLCENNDKFAIDRMLPKIDIGDIVYIHDTGAHGSAMGYNYNGKLRSAEVLLCEDGTHRLIRRAETPRDYFATLDFLPLMKPLFED